jgi:hypothetical protein
VLGCAAPIYRPQADGRWKVLWEIWNGDKQAVLRRPSGISDPVVVSGGRPML